MTLELFSTYKQILCDIHISSFTGTGEGVRFSLRGTTYQNNSLVNLEDIGEWSATLLCVTDQDACCVPPYTGEMGSALGNWLFPNGTRLLSKDSHRDFYRTRGQMIVLMHRRRGGEDGIYSCVIPDAMNVTQTIYVGVYSRADAGEWYSEILFNGHLPLAATLLTRPLNTIHMKTPKCGHLAIL